MSCSCPCSCSYACHVAHHFASNIYAIFFVVVACSVVYVMFICPPCHYPYCTFSLVSIPHSVLTPLSTGPRSIATSAPHCPNSNWMHTYALSYPRINCIYITISSVRSYRMRGVMTYRGERGRQTSGRRHAATTHEKQQHVKDTRIMQSMSHLCMCMCAVVCVCSTCCMLRHLVASSVHHHLPPAKKTVPFVWMIHVSCVASCLCAWCMCVCVHARVCVAECVCVCVYMQYMRCMRYMCDAICHISFGWSMC